MIWLPIDRRHLLKGGAGLAAAVTMPGATLVAPAHAASLDAKDNGPWVYWYWMDANITAEGIQADLRAMHGAGITGAIIFNIKGVNDATIVDPPVESQSPLWWEMLRTAARCAEKLGMKLAMNMCDGWGTAGGAWVTPEKSAQLLVWSEARVEARQITGQIAKPATELDDYRDVATFAFPIPDDWDATSNVNARVTTSWPIAQPERLGDPGQAGNIIESEAEGWIQFSFDRPFTLRSLVVRSLSIDILPFLSIGYSAAANSMVLQASDDGKTFKTFHRLISPVQGWQANLTHLAHSIPPKRAKHFRFVHEPDSLALVSTYDGRNAVTKQLALASLELRGRSVVDSHQVRSAEAWGITVPLTDAQLPASACIKAEDVIDISNHLSASGMCTWRAPDARRWAVVRIGATSNAKTTQPSGRMGGLECDKFDPDMAAMQFDRWFGAARKQIGSALANRVMPVLHMDSWEGRSQNWSVHLPRGFSERRGYEIGIFLLTMIGVPIGNAATTDGFLFDLRRTVGDLLCDNFFATIERLAHENDCLFSAEATNASFPSDGLRIHRHVDLPCGEFWRDRPESDKPSDVLEAASAAHLYGKQIVAAEAWTGGFDWGEHPFVFKAQGDDNFCKGVNRFIFHVWAHQAFPERKPGITMFGYGAFFSAAQPWWPMAGAWIDYIARCQELLQQGLHVADICYFIGEDIPARALRPDMLHPQLPKGYAYDSINADVLWTLAHVRNGRIEVPAGASYAVMVIQPDTAITSHTARKFKELVLQGATIFGPRPVVAPSLQDKAAVAEAEAILAELWDGEAHRDRVIASDDLASVLHRTGVEPDVDAPPSIKWIHRTEPKRDIYFLSNQGPSPQTAAVRLRTRHARAISFDPVTNQRMAIDVQRDKIGHAVVTVDLAVGGSIFLLLEQGSRLSAPPAPASLPRAQDIKGPWTLLFDNKKKSALSNVERLRSWTEEKDPAIRFHSGIAR